VGYVEKVLEPGEAVRYRGQLSWIVYVGPLAVVVVGAAIMLAGQAFASLALVFLAVGGLVLLFGLVRGLATWIERLGTELTVTDRRVIIKTGLIRRRTIEMNLGKIESVDVSQGLAGRLFNYGDVLVRGTGAGLEPLRVISKPLEFRRSILASEA